MLITLWTNCACIRIRKSKRDIFFKMPILKHVDNTSYRNIASFSPVAGRVEWYTGPKQTIRGASRFARDGVETAYPDCPGSWQVPVQGPSVRRLWHCLLRRQVRSAPDSSSRRRVSSRPGQVSWRRYPARTCRVDPFPRARQSRASVDGANQGARARGHRHEEARGQLWRVHINDPRPAVLILHFTTTIRDSQVHLSTSQTYVNKNLPLSHKQGTAKVE